MSHYEQEDKPSRFLENTQDLGQRVAEKMASLTSVSSDTVMAGLEKEMDGLATRLDGVSARIGGFYTRVYGPTPTDPSRPERGAETTNSTLARLANMMSTMQETLLDLEATADRLETLA